MEDKIGSFLRPCSIAYNIRGLGRSIVEINEAFFATKVPLITNILNVYSEEIGTSVEVSRGFDQKDCYANSMVSLHIG